MPINTTLTPQQLDDHFEMICQVIPNHDLIVWIHRMTAQCDNCGRWYLKETQKQKFCDYKCGAKFHKETYLRKKERTNNE